MITPCLWFDGQAEQAAKFYVSIFKKAKMGKLVHAGGKVLTASFTLDGLEFLGLNGGPQFKFTEAVSFQVPCETQAEVDHYWEKLAEGGQHSQCGWLKDKFGLSWQIVPTVLPKLLSDPKKSEGVMKALMQMKKLDIEALKRAGK
jgi:predicted 3-demethylubiquinone-9 3-methyltransferase (glyoxalase superfamily)